MPFTGARSAVQADGRRRPLIGGACRNGPQRLGRKLRVQNAALARALVPVLESWTRLTHPSVDLGRASTRRHRFYALVQQVYNTGIRRKGRGGAVPCTVQVRCGAVQVQVPCRRKEAGMNLGGGTVCSARKDRALASVPVRWIRHENFPPCRGRAGMTGRACNLSG